MEMGFVDGFCIEGDDLCTDIVVELETVVLCDNNKSYDKGEKKRENDFDVRYKRSDLV